MLGAIVGDIVGSIYERRNIKTKDFPLFGSRCSFTDDTVMTCAVAEAVMNGGKREDFVKAMKKYGRLYPNVGYGGKFRAWLFSDGSAPYGSFGNGSAMRVSSCAWAAECDSVSKAELPDRCRNLARLSAEVTHNHPEGVKGAVATADAIFLCRCYFGDSSMESSEKKRLIKEHIEREYGYDLSKTLDEIRPSYRFDVSCQGSVPQAITAFLESTDFEDAIRNAISIGGDSDTVAAITGSMAEAAYGIPDRIKEKACSYLDESLRAVVRRWDGYIARFGVE